MSISPWLEKFNRESRFKSAILLSGNTQDVIKNEKNNYVPLLQVVVDNLRKNGYSNVVVWDRIDGIDPKLSDKVDSSCSCKKTTNQYNFDDDDTQTEGQNNKYTELKEFFPIIANAIKNGTEKTAFVLNYSDFLFGTGGSLSEAERVYLGSLIKSVQNSQNYNLLNSSFEQVKNIIVLVARESASIPPIFYCGETSVSNIVVPLPGRTEREQFIKSNIGLLKVRENLNSDNTAVDNIVDATDSFSLKEIIQLMKLSRHQEDTMKFNKLISLYKYGKKSSPWEELSKDKLVTLKDVLKKRVKGQDQAVDKIYNVIIRAFTGLSGLQHSATQKKPKGTLFFVGPTGVGKTELAKALAEFLFGDENACIRFDMSEFNHENSDQRFVGAPPGYVGYEAGGQLTNAVKEKPFCVLLFDEVEKAHGRILDKFLQILEDGRLTDGKGETVSFAETFIIFTSNIGAAEIKPSDKNVSRQFIDKVRDHFVNELKRPELLNRIGNNVVPFNFINSAEVFAKIAEAKFKPYIDCIKEKYRANLRFENSEAAYKALADATDISNGGRGLLSLIETTIGNPLAEFLFMNSDRIEGRSIVIKPLYPDHPEKAAFDFELE